MAAKKSEVRASLAPRTDWLAILAPIAIVVAGWFAYASGFDGKFLFDDHTDIDGNAAIRDLSDPWKVMFDQGQSGVSGRPLVALSYAIEYREHAFDLAGWHRTNLAIHLVAALALFGVVRRALRAPRLAEQFASSSTAIAAATSLLWVVHPLTTASVQYLGERVESGMGMFFLLAFYCALRGFAAARAGKWYAAAVASAVCSASCKEVAAAIPVLVLLFDAQFVAGSFKSALRERRGLYVGLFAIWLLIATLVMTAEGRSESVGFSYAHVGVWGYLKTSAWAVVRYLRLSLWPSPLIFDYGKRPVSEVSQWLPQGLLLIALFSATVVGLVRRKPIAFLGAWWFVILAPTSSFLPIVTELIVEHRAYLPLAAVVLLAVLGTYGWLRALVPSPSVRAVVSALAVLGLTTALALATRARNADYRTEIGMWADVVAKLPSNDRAHGCYANDLRTNGQIEEAGQHYEEASRLAPDDPYWLANLGTYYLDRGRIDEAIEKLETSRALLPTYGMTLSNLGFAYVRKGQRDLAIESLQQALANSSPAPAYCAKYLGEQLAQAGRRVDGELYAALARMLQPAGGSDPVAEGKAIVSQMQRALTAAGEANLPVLDTVAKVQAEQGLRGQAAATARRMAAIHTAAGRPNDAVMLERRAARYEAGGK